MSRNGDQTRLVVRSRAGHLLQALRSPLWRRPGAGVLLGVPARDNYPSRGCPCVRSGEAQTGLATRRPPGVADLYLLVAAYVRGRPGAATDGERANAGRSLLVPDARPPFRCNLLRLVLYAQVLEQFLLDRTPDAQTKGHTIPAVKRAGWNTRLPGSAAGWPVWLSDWRRRGSAALATPLRWG